MQACGALTVEARIARLLGMDAANAVAKHNAGVTQIRAIELCAGDCFEGGRKRMDRDRIETCSKLSRLGVGSCGVRASETSNGGGPASPASIVCLRIAPRPSRQARQVSASDSPSGVTAPRPVTTMRRA